MADKMKSFFSRLGKKEPISTLAEDWSRTLGLVRSNDSSNLIVEINEQNCPAADENAVSDMCLAIQQQASGHVMSLRIRNRSIEPSIEFVASLCSTTQSLAELRLSSCGINDHESNCIVAALLTNRSIRTLAVDHNNITSSEPWGQLLLLNKTLESLDLTHNKLCVVKGSDQSMSLLVQGLVGNKRLRDLYLIGNGVQESSVKLLTKVVEEKGDSMALRNIDLVNDSSLSQTVRDALAVAMARPVVGGGIGLRKPRTADDPEGTVLHPTRNAANQAPGSKAGLAAATAATAAAAAAAASSSPSANSNSNLHHNSSNNNNEDLDDGEISISNMSFSNDGDGEAAADAAALRAQKIAKIKGMQERYRNDMKRRDALERDLRDQIARSSAKVSDLEQQLMSAKALAAAAVAAQQVAASAATGSAAKSSGEAEARLRETLQQQLAQQEHAARLQVEGLVERHQAELKRRDEEQAQRDRDGTSREQELTALVASFGEKSEQARMELVAVRRDLESERQERSSAAAAAKQQLEEREKRIKSDCALERDQVRARCAALEAQATAAQEQCEQAAAASHRLQETASAEITRLRAQLEAALNLSRLTVVGNNNNNNNNKNVVDGHNNTRESATKPSFAALLDHLCSNSVAFNEMEVQTDLLPEVKAMVSPAPQVPMMDISSVTRFKMPAEHLERRGSGDSFIGSDDGNGASAGGKYKWVPKSKWVPDDQAANCFCCKAKFGLFGASRHHCRSCAQNCCSQCAPIHPKEKKRVCHNCIAKFER